MPTPLNSETIYEGLRLLGERLRVDREVELTVVGGAAGVLTGDLPASWTTADVDVLPPREIEALLDAAAEVQKLLSLPPAWLNDFAGLWYHGLPEGWEHRRVEVGVFGQLKVSAINRLDQIAMKFLAHRATDLKQLSTMNVSEEELGFVRRHLTSLTQSWPEEAARSEMALSLAKEWFS